VPKLYRTDAPPAGAFVPVRNRRLYGDREEQISGVALRARGCPNTDRAYVGSRKRAELRVERENRAVVERTQRAQTAMLEAQRAVRAAKQAGQDFADLATRARALRAEYLSLTGGVESHAVETAAYALKSI
jgi:hypothetical protein